MPKEELNFQQEQFCQEYVANLGNGTQAVKKAYPGMPSDESASVHASKLLRSAKVKARLEELRREITEQNAAKIAAVVEILKPDEMVPAVVGRMKLAFDKCEKERDLNSLGRTLLEWAKVLGATPQAAVQINFNGDDRPLDKLGAFDLMEMKKAIDAKLEEKLSLNTGSSSPAWMTAKVEEQSVVNSPSSTPAVCEGSKEVTP